MFLYWIPKSWHRFSLSNTMSILELWAFSLRAANKTFFMCSSFLVWAIRIIWPKSFLSALRIRSLPFCFHFHFLFLSYLRMSSTSVLSACHEMCTLESHSPVVLLGTSDIYSFQPPLHWEDHQLYLQTQLLQFTNWPFLADFQMDWASSQRQLPYLLIILGFRSSAWCTSHFPRPSLSLNLWRNAPRCSAIR